MNWKCIRHARLTYCRIVRAIRLEWFTLCRHDWSCCGLYHGLVRQKFDDRRHRDVPIDDGKSYSTAPVTRTPTSPEQPSAPEICPAPCFRPFRHGATQTESSFKKCPACSSRVEACTVPRYKCDTLNPISTTVKYHCLFGFQDSLLFNFDPGINALKRTYLQFVTKVDLNSASGPSELPSQLRTFGFQEQKLVADSVSATITHAY